MDSTNRNDETALPTVEAHEANQRVNGGAYLLDVREAEEWNAGHAPAANWIPLGDLPTRFGELPAATEIFVVCKVGGRSAAAVETLIGTGMTAINCAGGMLAWADAELPVVTADGSPGQVI